METKIVLVIGGMLLVYLFLAVVLPLLPDAIRRFQNYVEQEKQRKKCKKYRGRVLGEIVGEEAQERPNRKLIRALLSRQGRLWVKLDLEDEYTYYTSIYSPTIRYEVDGESYEVNAYHYSGVRPVLGQKALVYYNEYNPSDAAVEVARKYRLPLKILARDGQGLCCSCGWKRNISIPWNEVDERALPGRSLVHKYGVYSLDEYSARKAKGPLKVERCDEEFAYCSYGPKRDMLVSLKEIADGKPVPGDKIAYKYGLYYIEGN